MNDLVDRVMLGLPSNSKQRFDFYANEDAEGYVESNEKGISQICIYEAGEEY